VLIDPEMDTAFRTLDTDEELGTSGDRITNNGITKLTTVGEVFSSDFSQFGSRF